MNQAGFDFLKLKMEMIVHDAGTKALSRESSPVGLVRIRRVHLGE